MQDSTLAIAYKPYVTDSAAKNVLRLSRSIASLIENKKNSLVDACDYYSGLFIYSLIMGICSIYGTILIGILIKNGWASTNSDIKITLGCILMIISISYFIPKLMNNEQNYKENIGSYYVYNKQIIYSTNIISYHYCCDTSAAYDSIVCKVADSNYSILSNNVTMHYDINFSEATKHVEEFTNGIKETKHQ